MGKGKKVSFISLPWQNMLEIHQSAATTLILRLMLLLNNSKMQDQKPQEPNQPQETCLLGRRQIKI